jgi:prophage regulatory protein
MRLLSFKELKPAKGIPYSKAHLYRLIKLGRFPRPVPIGENRVGFVDEEIDAHIRAMMAARDAEHLSRGTP